MITDEQRRRMAAEVVWQQQQKPIDPLPVMEWIAEEMAEHWPYSNERKSVKRLHEVIQQMHRERGDTQAAEHVRKLKEVEGGSIQGA